MFTFKHLEERSLIIRSNYVNNIFINDNTHFPSTLFHLVWFLEKQSAIDPIWSNYQLVWLKSIFLVEMVLLLSKR